MKYAIISDVHANLEALETVLADARPQVDAVVCLGDIVGYNADPNACVRIIRETCDLVVIGNHDQAAIGERPYDDFSDYARESMDWTRRHLKQSEKIYLKELPTTAKFGVCWLAAHGSPRDTDEYLFHVGQFRENFAFLRKRLPDIRCCFIGHTHLPMAWQCTPEGVTTPVEVKSTTLELDPWCDYIVNPGSVGQPRYGKPASTYAILDDDTLTVEFRFVPYDVGTTQEKIYDAGLPPYLAERLGEGR
jgi:predicted phosphodiesterase